MTDELDKIRTLYLAKARKDRSLIKNQMATIFGYTTRNVMHKLKGDVVLTDKEIIYLYRALKIKK